MHPLRHIPFANCINVSDVEIAGSKITVRFRAFGRVARYFNTPGVFETEYSVPIDGVSAGMAIIPFVCNVLPIIWVTDATLRIPAVDETFFNSIENIKRGYMEMFAGHPEIRFRGRIKVKNVIPTPPAHNRGGGRTAMFFSGGVDSFCTLYSHLESRPTLITLWGSDIPLDDTAGWRNLKSHIEATAAEFNLPYVTVKSNFRTFLREHILDRLTATCNDGWWHAMQHGIGILSHAAPLVPVLDIATIFFASSLTAETRKGVVIASDPCIDNRLRMGNAHVVHDGFEYSRFGKTDLIVRHVHATGKYPELHVCWQASSHGTNCCRCEKCMRTVFSLFACGEDPRKYGLPYTAQDLADYGRHDSSDTAFFPQRYWVEIRRKIKENPGRFLPREAEWITDAKFQPPQPII